MKFNHKIAGDTYERYMESLILALSNNNYVQQDGQYMTNALNKTVLTISSYTMERQSYLLQDW